ncbi:MAG TPA: hypothetical protein VEV16_02860 [Daejeonella sp.]|nr:hypothetical protein [Daejeonella sp.]
MKENVENFIRDHKRDFDRFEPPAHLWEKIEKKLDEQQKSNPKQGKVIRLSVLFKIAASVVVILAAGLWMWQYENKQQVNLAYIDPGLAKQQAHYASLIEIKRSELKQIEKEDPQLYSEFSAEIRKMDDNYQRLKNDLPNSPNQEETVKAMIRNLQIQTQVLNQQLNIIQQINQSKKEHGNGTQSI